MAIEVGHDWARKMIQELVDLGHHGGTLMLYVAEQEARDRRLAELEALLANQPAPTETGPVCLWHPSGACSRCGYAMARYEHRLRECTYRANPAPTETGPWIPAPGERIRRKYDGAIVTTLVYTPTGYVRYEKPDGKAGSDHIRAIEPLAEPAPQGAPHSYAIGAGGGDDGCSACGAGQHEPCKSDCGTREVVK